MKIKFIGVGGAFAPISKGNSNMLITSDDGHMLMVDMGSTAPYILRDELKISFNDIEALYLSHLHSDHCGGVEMFAFHRYFIPSKDAAGKVIKPKLFMMTDLMHEAWEHTLKGGLESVEGKVNHLTDYFQCMPVKENSIFTWRSIDFQPVQTVHICTGYMLKNSYGLIIRPFTMDASEDEPKKVYRKTIFITTDTQFCPYQLRSYYNQSDIVFHDCETLVGMKSHVHAHYEDLNTLPSEIKAKFYLYHYGDKVPTVKEDGFLGFVDKFQEFEF